MSHSENSLSPEPEAPAPVSTQEISGPAVTGGENPPWGIWDVLRIVAVAMVAIGLLSVVGLGLAMRLAGPVKPLPADLARNARVVVPAQFAAYLVVIAYMAWLVRSRAGALWQAIKWNWPNASWFGWVALGVGLALLVQSASALLPIPKSLPIDRYFRDTLGAYMMMVFGLTLAPLMEELFFRGFLYPALARSWGMGPGVVVTSALFALIHTSQLANAWAPLLLLFCVGVVLTLLRARTHSVATTFLVHVGYNGTLFTMLYLASDHFRHFERLG